jgi:hypothetical protein
VLAGAHVADGAGPLAVPREPGGGQLVKRHVLGAAGEQGLGDLGAPEERLERPDVDVLARVGAGEDRDLRRLEVERGDPAGLEQGDRPERLDAAPERDEAIRIAQLADHTAGRVHLDDVASVDALLDPVADLANEDGSRLARLGCPLRLRCRRLAARAGPGGSSIWAGRRGHGPPDLVE